MTDQERKRTDLKLIATPFSYGDLVGYQESSIVSRTIIDKTEGTVTVFAFDAGQRLSTHSASFDALAEVIEGSGLFTIEGTDHEVSAGRQIILPANKPHAVSAIGRFKMALIMIRAK
jgi:quercetin dioxygenase-like cupin family protein